MFEEELFFELKINCYTFICLFADKFYCLFSFSCWQAGAKDGDLRRENTQLKSNIALLRSQVNDRNNLDKLQLQEKNAQLEHEKRSLEMIVQALCEKIINEKGPEGDLAG